jgi:hypothetical protein
LRLDADRDKAEVLPAGPEGGQVGKEPMPVVDNVAVDSEELEVRRLWASRRKHVVDRSPFAPVESVEEPRNEVRDLAGAAAGG